MLLIFCPLFVLSVPSLIVPVLFSHLLVVVVFGGTESDCVAQAGLELKIFLSQPAECWDYRHTQP